MLRLNPSLLTLPQNGVSCVALQLFFEKRKCLVVYITVPLSSCNLDVNVISNTSGLAKKLQILKHGYSKHKVKSVAKKICVQSLLWVTIKQSHQFGI